MHIWNSSCYFLFQQLYSVHSSVTTAPLPPPIHYSILPGEKIKFFPGLLFEPICQNFLHCISLYWTLWEFQGPFFSFPGLFLAFRGLISPEPPYIFFPAFYCISFFSSGFLFQYSSSYSSVWSFFWIPFTVSIIPFYCISFFSFEFLSA